MKKLFIFLTTLFIIFYKSYGQTWGVNNTRTEYRNNAGLQGNEGAMSGFYQTAEPVNFPAGSSSWWHLLDVRHDNPNNNYAMQFSGSFFDQSLYFRKTNDNASQPWSRVLLETNGNVGIGTPAPQATLHISSNASSSNTIGQYSGNLIIQGNSGGRSLTSGASLEFVIPANTDGSNAWGQGRIITVAGNGASGDATGKMILGTRRMFDKGSGLNYWNYGDDIVIDGAGHVGINTTSPREALSVNGNIRAKEIKVESSPWPDFVFAPANRLLTLNEVSAYIAKNHHLPDMPSAEEVAKEGVSLGEMNRLLAKKIEELTLYLIEKDREVKSQRTQLNSQVNVIKLQLRKNKLLEARLARVEHILSVDQKR